jgi:hypothetical protein
MKNRQLKPNEGRGTTQEGRDLINSFIKCVIRVTDPGLRRAAIYISGIISK